MNGTTRTRRGLRRVLGLSLGGAMIMAMTPGVASAQTPAPDARTTDDVCEDSVNDYDRDRFDDTRGSAHELNVLCMAARGLTQGLSGGDSYGPRLDVNRGQMASFIARFIEDATGEELAEGEGFRDVPDSYDHSENINKIENIGVTEGTRRSDGEEYDPLADVSRGQMASFISRALTYIVEGHGQPETVPDRSNVDYFPDDDGSVHEDNINALAGARIVEGFDDGDYRWAASVKRDQMASFIMRAYDYAVEEGIVNFGPILASSVPEDGATDVPVGTNVSADFDRNLSEDSTIELVCGDTAIGGAVTVTDSTIVFDPTDDLDYAADCAALISAVAADDGIEALWGIEFTTEAAPAATVNSDQVTVSPGGDLTVALGGDTDQIDTVDVAGDCVADGPVTIAPDDTATIPIEAGATEGAPCILTFAVTFDDGSTQDVTFSVQIATLAATVETTPDTAAPGGEVTATFAGDVDEIDTVEVAGACVTDGPVTVADGTATIRLEDTAAEGACELTFTVTFADGTTATPTATVTVDATSPAIAGAAVSEADDTITVTYGEPVDCDADADPAPFTQFSYSDTDNTDAGPTAILCDGSATVVLRFADGVLTDADLGTLTYTDDDTATVEAEDVLDLVGNQAESPDVFAIVAP